MNMNFVFYYRSKDSYRIDVSKKYEMSQDEIFVLLIIRDVLEKDLGSFILEVFNDFGFVFIFGQFDV